MKPAQAYPLTWPRLTARTLRRASSRFSDKTIPVALKSLKQELGRLNAGYVVISTNIPLKANGDPYSDPGRMPDPGVAIYFHLDGKPYCLPCDRWISVEENLYAVAKHVEAMRGMDRWGVGSIEQTFAGFKELSASSEEDWTVVLGLTPEATVYQIKLRHHNLAKVYHPDCPSGSVEDMQRLNAARDRALASWEADR